jgi:hypothetical protein
MSIQRLVPFSFHYLGDGTSTNVTITLATDYYLLAPGQGVKPTVSMITSVMFAADPGDGSTVKLTLGVITLTLAQAPPANQVCTFNGYLVF